jgi:hypothetical protein
MSATIKGEQVIFHISDTALLATLDSYRSRVTALGADPAELAAIDQNVSDMKAWRRQNKDKLTLAGGSHQNFEHRDPVKPEADKNEKEQEV